jgi:hypothetical protein
MSSHADTTRKRIQERVSGWRSSARPSHDTAYTDCLREIEDDVVIVSPKVYESGIITRFDLRLVDLYGDCIVENDIIPAPAEHELVY